MNITIVPEPGIARQGAPGSDADYVEAAKAIVRMAQNSGLTPSARILDIGCGAGRFLTGLLATYGRVNEYVGLDVRKQLIDWCRKAFDDRSYGNIRFEWINKFNARYNRTGEPVSQGIELPIDSRSFDFVILYSVFSHMTVEDTRAYLFEVARALDANGHCLCTAFVEDDVPAWEENPVGYLGKMWKRPLHCALFNKALFEGLIGEAGLKIVAVHRPGGQTVYTVRLS
jgi:ubiquinone/menaquinone biosynthesis C-methylase UbiE